MQNCLLPGSPHHVSMLAAQGTHRCYRRGALLIQEGETGDSLYIVLEGRLRTFLSDGQGKELTPGVYGPLEYVGEMALDGGPRSANVEALEPSVCAVVTRKAVLDYIAVHPDFALELMRCIIHRARMTTDRVRSVALVDVYGRLVRLLDQLSEPPDEHGARRLRERLTHLQLSHYLACSREMVSRLLKDLETGGYIEVRERRIWLIRSLPPRW